MDRGAYLLTARGGFELYASWESQACFGNSFLGILTGPRDNHERLATTAAVRAACDALAERGIVSTSARAPPTTPRSRPCTWARASAVRAC